MVVDLPAPFGPRRATVSPRATSRHRSSTATSRAVPVTGAFEAEGGRWRPVRARRVKGKGSEGHFRPSA